MKRLTLEDIKIPKPDLKITKAPKSDIIAQWLIDWIKYSLEHGIADFGDFIPAKETLALYLGVSGATVQNAIRQVKNLGYFSSKQSLGTSIQDFYSKDIKPQDELYRGTVAICKIKKAIIDDKISINCAIPSVYELSKRTEISKNTIRFSLDTLCNGGFLERKHIKGNRYLWILKKEFKLSKEEIINGINDEDFTLKNQLVGRIQKYLEKTYKPKEKILPNMALSNMFNVSIKTINDAMKVLNTKKVVLSRRGRYGTIYLGKEQNSKTSFFSSERKKFNNEMQNYNYTWQKTLHHLKKYIIENYKQGDKIAPIRELAKILNVSPNTIRRALSDLFQQRYLVSRRGKSGGIFIVEMPLIDEKTYKWIALNKDVINIKRKPL